MRYRLHGFLPWQAEVYANPARFKVVNGGRRLGKTRFGAGMAIAPAIEGGRTWWVAPTSQLAQVGWRTLRNLARKIPGAQVRLVDRTIVLPSGGWVQVRTAGEPGGLISEGLDYVVYDEAARGSEESWSAELRPALTDRKGGALFISTPRGRANWFHTLYQHARADDPAWAAWTFPSSVNPHLDPDEIEDARGSMPVDVFGQEYLALFNDAGSSPFDEKDIEAMPGGWAGLREPALGGLYLTAWDIGRKRDATVGITIDYAVEPYQVVAFERMEGVPYPAQQEAITARHAAYPGRTIVEDNGPGDPVVGNLGVTVEGFTTGPKNKVNAIQSLRLLLERGALKADIPALTGELLAYQWDDKGLRQDCVMALAIAALHLPKPDRREPGPPPIGPTNRTSMGSYLEIQL